MIKYKDVFENGTPKTESGGLPVKASFVDQSIFFKLKSIFVNYLLLLALLILLKLS
jgi:hypothetical protein